jgi:hypothetical protein
MLRIVNLCLIKYNFFIAFCSVATILYFSILTEVKISIFYYIFTFFGTLAVYNLFRLSLSFYQIFKKNQEKLSQILIIVSLLICSISFIFIPGNSKYSYILPFILSLLYQFSFFGEKNLRRFPYFKILIIAFVWLLMTLIPFFEADLNPEKLTQIYFLCSSQFLFYISLAIPFDVFDQEKDEIKTLAKIIGPQKAINASIFSLFCFLLINLLENSNFEHKIAHISFTFIASLSLLNYKKFQTVAAQYFFIDGLIILQVGIFFLISK